MFCSLCESKNVNRILLCSECKELPASEIKLKINILKSQIENYYDDRE